MFTARVVNGQIKLDEPQDLPEGAVLHVAIADTGDELDEAEREELDEALSRSWAQAQAGQVIPFEEVLRELRSS